MRIKLSGTSLQFARAWGQHKLKVILGEDGVIFNADDLLGHTRVHSSSSLSPYRGQATGRSPRNEHGARLDKRLVDAA